MQQDEQELREAIAELESKKKLTQEEEMILAQLQTRLADLLQDE